MATAEELAKTEAAAKKKNELATLSSPGVRLPEAIRPIISKYCRDKGEAFSPITVKMWIKMLKAEKIIPADMVIDIKAAGGGGIKKLKDDVIAKDVEIEKLQAELAKLKTAKK